MERGKTARKVHLIFGEWKSCYENLLLEGKGYGRIFTLLSEWNVTSERKIRVWKADRCLGILHRNGEIKSKGKRSFVKNEKYAIIIRY